jgi:hypothetical protein
MHGTHSHVTRHHLICQPCSYVETGTKLLQLCPAGHWRLNMSPVSVSPHSRYEFVDVMDLLFVCFAGYGYNASVEKQVLNSVVAGGTTFTTDSLNSFSVRWMSRRQPAPGRRQCHMEAVSTAYAACAMLLHSTTARPSGPLLALRQLWLSLLRIQYSRTCGFARSVYALGNRTSGAQVVAHQQTSSSTAQLSCDSLRQPLQAVQPVGSTLSAANRWVYAELLRAIHPAAFLPLARMPTTLTPVKHLLPAPRCHCAEPRRDSRKLLDLATDQLAPLIGPVRVHLIAHANLLIEALHSVPSPDNAAPKRCPSSFHPTSPQTVHRYRSAAEPFRHESPCKCRCHSQRSPFAVRSDASSPGESC